MNSIKYRNLEFTKNNIYVIFGDNGVGKSTFLTSIFLFKKYFNENIYYDGKSVDSLSRSEKNKLQRNMIFMKSKGNLLDFLTVKENLEYFKIDPDNINRTKFLEKKPNELSGGEEQISSLSLLFQKDKEVLLLDHQTLIQTDRSYGGQIFIPHLSAQLSNDFRIACKESELKLNERIGSHCHRTDGCDYIQRSDLGVFHDETVVWFRHDRIWEDHTGRLEIFLKPQLFIELCLIDQIINTSHWEVIDVVIYNSRTRTNKVIIIFGSRKLRRRI